MKFSELIADWEDGWRGYALDGDGNKHDFTKDYIIDIEVGIGEEWVKFIEEDEVENNVFINMTVNNIGELDNIMQGIQKQGKFNLYLTLNMVHSS